MVVGGKMVNMLPFKSDDPSSNPTEVLFSKRPGMDQLKKFLFYSRVNCAVAYISVLNKSYNVNNSN